MNSNVGRSKASVYFEYQEGSRNIYIDDVSGDTFILRDENNNGFFFFLRILTFGLALGFSLSSCLLL